MSQSTQPSPASMESTSDVSPVAIDASCRWPVLGLYYGAAVWLVLSAVAYLVASMSFHAPAMFADCAAFSYGRMAPLASNLLIYGFCIPAGWATTLWLLARSGRTPLAHPVWVMVGAKLWNIGILIGSVGILVGDASGFDSMEFPLYAAWALLLASLLIGIAGLNTLRNRTEREMHPAQWFAGLSVLWFPWIYVTAIALLQVAPVRGMAQGAMHGWFEAQLQVVLLGLTGVAALFYFLPVLKRQPLASRQLALFALITLIFCGGWTGVALSAPMPAWITTISKIMSVCLIMPVVAIVLNVWHLRSGSTTSEGRYLRFGLLSLILWTALIIVTNGTPLWKTIAFTLAQPALSQLFLQGFSVMIALGAAYHILPRIVGGPLPFPRFARAHFWLASIGIILVVLPFFVGGIKQGVDLANAEIAFTKVAGGTLMPIRVASMGQLLLILGHLLLVVNLVGLMVRLVFGQLKKFDNAPVGLTCTTEGRA